MGTLRFIRVYLLAVLFDDPGHRMQIFLLDGTGEVEHGPARHPIGRRRERPGEIEDATLLVF
jgi:hypothetical protein